MNLQGHTHITLDELLHTRLWLGERVKHGVRSGAGLLAAGRQLTRRHGQSSEFDQVRDYQPGDDARHIDWRASARAGSIQSRLFQQERDRPVFILLEQSPAMFFASAGNFKSVQAAIAASLFAWAADEQRSRVGGLIFGQQPQCFMPPGRHRQSVLHLLHAIARANQALNSPFAPNGDNPLQQALLASQQRIPPGSLVILLCSASHLDEHCSGQLAALATRHDSIWLPVSDPLERQLPAQAAGLAGADNRQLWLRRRRNPLQQQWQQHAQHIRQRWQQLASQHQVSLIPVCTTSNLARQLAGLKENGHVS